MKIVEGCIASGSVLRRSHSDELCEDYDSPTQSEMEL
jgi:hypothetical protein